MRGIVLSKAVVLLAFIVILAVPPVQAAQARPAANAVRGVFSLGFLSQAWDFLTSVWDRNGCGLDPDGNCLPQGSADNGCRIDPDGRCLPQGSAPEPDNGCGLDPNGGCRPQTTAPEPDNGCRIDPNGGCSS